MKLNTTSINFYLDKKNVKHSSLGFKYLVSAFMITGIDASQNITMAEVYQKVANKHGTRPNCVERAIRYSIKHQGITNKEFIFKAFHESFVIKEAN